MGFIYSMQMNNYALGPSMIFCMLLILNKILNKEPQRLIKWLIIGATIGLLIFGHYQVLFFLPAFYTTLFISQFQFVNDDSNSSVHE